MPLDNLNRSKIKTAVVLSGHTMSALWLTRSLGRQGVRVILLTDTMPTFGGLSKYSWKTIKVPSFFGNSDDAAQMCQRILRYLDPSIVFAPTDGSVLFVHRYLQIFENHYCAVPEADICEWAFDKSRTVDLCKELELPVPLSWFPEHFESISDLINEVRYPCVVKPRRSIYWTGKAKPIFGGKFELIFDSKQLRCCLERNWVIPPIVQQFISGKGAGIYLLAEHGEIKMVMGQERLRESHPCGSGACLAQTIALDEEQLAMCEKIVRKTGWHGVAMIELKVADRPYVMEINGRFWNSLALSIQAGCDFPWQLFRMYAGLGVDWCGSYQIGCKSRYLAGDIIHLIHALAGPPPNWPGWYPRRLEALFSLLRGFSPNVSSYTFAWDDPLPWLGELWVFLRQKIKSVRK